MEKLDKLVADNTRLVARVRELETALEMAVNLTCNCAGDPEFRVLGHAGFCVIRTALTSGENHVEV
jgi:hypothetical protein